MTSLTHSLEKIMIEETMTCIRSTLPIGTQWVSG
ncbi:hypothetical protein SAMN05216571_103237 [Onishia taeanensis]|jgi:hypothetical protein|uniref:Uncharacterized protein n=1 Tax=Onishia taeanensis TaxID=284577 RepID=A0A1G7QFU4_9GAMM|nr:hypothetical protein SAMN05216571_103237 [Halomonas taeanensis]